jgi:hypothetical protein
LTFASVCDAFLLDLTTSVSGLSDATQHRYASWSSAAVADTTPGRHIAVWPEGDPETRQGATSDGMDLVTTSYQVMVWEGATSEATRVYDDDDANAAWLALYEAVKARMYVRTNQGLGDTGSTLNYEGGKLDRVGDKRVFAVRFTKRRYESYT